MILDMSRFVVVVVGSKGRNSEIEDWLKMDNK